MADNKSTKHSQEWMALTIWVGLFLGTLVSSIYMLSNLNLPSQILFQISNSFGQLNPATGDSAWTAYANGALYAALLLYVGMIYFLVSSWLKLGAMLLEMVIHYAKDSNSESVFATMLYLSRRSVADKSFDPDEAEGSMPGEIVRNLGYAWVANFLIYGFLIAIPFFL